MNFQLALRTQTARQFEVQLGLRTTKFNSGLLEISCQKEERKQAGDHALPRTGFRASASAPPEGRNGGGAIPSNTGLRWQCEKRTGISRPSSAKLVDSRTVTSPLANLEMCAAACDFVTLNCCVAGELVAYMHAYFRPRMVGESLVFRKCSRM
jgi:hypothetical protein